MSVIQTSLFSVITRFPDRKDEVIRLFRESESFQTVCDDYRRCVEALEYWNQSDSEEAPIRRDEYAALLVDLEAEILEHLSEFSPRVSH